MRARIAPEPISAGLGAVGDYRHRAFMEDSRAPKASQMPIEPAVETPPVVAAQLPPDEAPATSAFAAAVISSTQETLPDARRQMQQSGHRAALPAQGSLALHDRRV